LSHFSGVGHQLSYAMRYLIPTLLVFAGIVAAMYYGGLGNATVPTTYLQSPMYDTTNLETLSLDAFFSFDFYCNSSASGKPITLTPKIPALSGTENPTFSPIAFPATNLPDFGCGSLPLSSGLFPVCCSAPVVNSIVISPFVFIVAVLTLVGWLIFSIFCGVGMAALPYDWLNEFKHRPRPITTQV
jgi:hypothetical protein